jgi:hypothetical protein
VKALLLLCAGVMVARAADPPGTAASHRAIAECEGAREASAKTQADAYRESLAHADAAIAADERDALGHFAAFCALGGLLRQSGLSLASPARLRRLRREVDRTLELAPDFSDALAGKGALLLNLPRLLGGDAAEGERLLRRALEIDADYLTPRLALVDALRARGARDEARMEAARALAIAERKGSGDSALAAREALAALGRDSGPP